MGEGIRYPAGIWHDGEIDAILSALYLAAIGLH